MWPANSLVQNQFVKQQSKLRCVLFSKYLLTSQSNFHQTLDSLHVTSLRTVADQLGRVISRLQQALY